MASIRTRNESRQSGCRTTWPRSSSPDTWRGSYSPSGPIPRLLPLAGGVGARPWGPKRRPKRDRGSCSSRGGGGGGGGGVLGWGAGGGGGGLGGWGGFLGWL